jgi:YetA-like protein
MELISSASVKQRPVVPERAIRLQATCAHSQGYYQVGVPLPMGWLRMPEVVLESADEQRIVPCQVSALARWHDGSVQWLEVLVLANHEQESPPEWLLRPRGDHERSPLLARKVRIEELPTSVQIHTGTHSFSWPNSGEWNWECRANSVEPHARGSCRFIDARGMQHAAVVKQCSLLRNGPLVASYLLQGIWAGTEMEWEAELDFLTNSAQVRMQLTVKNPRRARHAGGFWDLGDAGSYFLRELSVDVALQAAGVPQVLWQTDPSESVQTAAASKWCLRQESSGGENWQSANHVNRHGKVPLRYRGYRVEYGAQESSGTRANPVVCLHNEETSVACAVPEFWQKFPTAVAVEGSRLSVQLLPSVKEHYHELQAGEHLTRVVWFDFGADHAAAMARMAQVYQPATIRLAAETIYESESIWNLPSPQASDRAELHSIRSAALDGARNFFAKREAIDEFGWRNFGDVWADHESAYCPDPAPVVSHYNNQYDLLHSLLIEYLRTGDSRWWQLADPLARHVMDIDIYHTQRDKPAYNGGLFWHTAHYHAAGLASHRCASTTQLGKKIVAFGTGPCNEHNYSTGLLLYHYLTGSRHAREAVLGLAQWVIAMDDGRRHVLGVASAQPTGDASRTNEAEYHGAGRGAGNSVNALLNAWLLTEDESYLVKAQELIERCIHPHDDLAAKRLENAELRWSYTVFLQAIMRLEQLTRPHDRLANLRHYIKACVLHYARWMAAHERFYLDTPEALEYPTETWAAQELRKGTTLLMAARYAVGNEAQQWHERGVAMLDRAWQSLLQFPTYDTTRPLAVALQQGYLETALRAESFIGQQSPGDLLTKLEWLPSVEFISQKRDVKQSLRSPLGWLRMVRQMAQPQQWWQVYRQSWLAEFVRRGFR